LAGTSERGCCPKCGKPWERVVERETTYTGNRDTGDTYTAKAYASPQSEPRGSKKNLGGDAAPSRTTGWRPGCECGCEPVPCVVLDPFFGAGTTGLVAKQEGRGYVGIELNPKYVEMARERITDVDYEPTLC